MQHFCTNIKFTTKSFSIMYNPIIFFLTLLLISFFFSLKSKPQAFRLNYRVVDIFSAWPRSSSRSKSYIWWLVHLRLLTESIPLLHASLFSCCLSSAHISPSWPPPPPSYHLASLLFQTLLLKYNSLRIIAVPLLCILSITSYSFRNESMVRVQM